MMIDFLFAYAMMSLKELLHITERIVMVNVGTICKRACLPAVAAILFVCALFGGCKNNETALPSDVKEAFLTVYFTSNYEGRYDALLKIIGKEMPEGMTQEKQIDFITDQYEQAIERYYRDIRQYVSEDMLNTMMANRDNIKYEKLAREKGIACIPTGFEFEEYSKSGDETTYSFVAHMTLSDADGAETNGTMKGQITVQPGEDGDVISNFYISPIGFIADEALPTP